MVPSKPHRVSQENRFSLNWAMKNEREYSEWLTKQVLNHPLHSAFLKFTCSVSTRNLLFKCNNLLTHIRKSPGTCILTTNSGCNLFWLFRLTYRPLAYTQEMLVSTSREIPCSSILWSGIIEDYTTLIVKFFVKKLKTRNMLIIFK